MNIEQLIPSFEVGEMVILHWRPFEFVCPSCGAQISAFTDIEPHSIESTIVKGYSFLKQAPDDSGNCECIVDMPEGFYTVRNKRGEIAVPYTLLEKIIKEVDHEQS